MVHKTRSSLWIVDVRFCHVYSTSEPQNVLVYEAHKKTPSKSSTVGSHPSVLSSFEMLVLQQPLGRSPYCQ